MEHAIIVLQNEIMHIFSLLYDGNLSIAFLRRTEHWVNWSGMQLSYPIGHFLMNRRMEIVIELVIVRFNSKLYV